MSLFVPSASSRRAAGLVLVAVMTLLLSTFAAPAQTPAQAQVLPAGPVTNVRYDIVNHSKTINYIDRAHRLGSCSTPGGTCTISVSSSATRTVGLALGASRGFVAGQLDFSSSKTVTVATSCARKTPRGYVYSGYPRGSLHKYRIRRTASTVYSTYRSNASAASSGVTTSGYKYAFNPYRNGIACLLEKKR